MNTVRLSLYLLLAGSCPLALASAPQPTPSPTPAAQAHPHPHSTAMPGMMGTDQMFAMLDADKNGSISRAEFDAHQAAMHKSYGGATHKAYGGAMHHGRGPGDCMPMMPATTPKPDDAPKADAGK